MDSRPDNHPLAVEEVPQPAGGKAGAHRARTAGEDAGHDHHLPVRRRADEPEHAAAHRDQFAHSDTPLPLAGGPAGGLQLACRNETALAPGQRVESASRGDIRR